MKLRNLQVYLVEDIKVEAVYRNCIVLLSNIGVNDDLVGLFLENITAYFDRKVLTEVQRRSRLSKLL